VPHSNAGAYGSAASPAGLGPPSRGISGLRGDLRHRAGRRRAAAVAGDHAAGHADRGRHRRAVDAGGPGLRPGRPGTRRAAGPGLRGGGVRRCGWRRCGWRRAAAGRGGRRRRRWRCWSRRSGGCRCRSPGSARPKTGRRRLRPRGGQRSRSARPTATGPTRRKPARPSWKPPARNGHPRGCVDTGAGRSPATAGH